MALRNLLLAVVAIVLYSCASQVAPTGGEKDITPPAVIRSSPENLSTHFHSKEIKITFDEWVQLNDPAGQIFFSPALSKNPRYRMHGKTLTITLPDSLQPGTTYSVNFGSAIQDVNEKNTLLSYRYVFSTGDYIDSLRIGGMVTEATTGLPAKNTLVMLYDETNDSVIVKQRPSYYSRTGDDGSFTIDYLKEDDYKLVALNDANFNLQYDIGEELAFADTEISVKDTSGIYLLTLFQPSVDAQKILSAHSTAPGKVVLAFAKPLQSFSIRYSDYVRQETETNNSRDTAVFWVSATTLDSIDLYVYDNSFTDTVRVRMKTSDPEKKILPHNLN